MDITQMINTEIRMFIFFAAEGGEALSAKPSLVLGMSLPNNMGQKGHEMPPKVWLNL